MSVHRIPAPEALRELRRYDTVIDARSEGEFTEDHLPDAVNWPSLNDAERMEVGTLYKQVSPFEAKKRGAGLVAANISRHIAREVLDKPKSWRPLVYCWRGGQRSGSLAMVLGQIGFRVDLVEGGYKAWRAEVLQEIPKVVDRLRFKVICGPTGSGKTRLLHALKTEGAQVLDLEGLASHRSSVLGLLPDQPQPSQKRFDSLVWEGLGQFSSDAPVFVESESRKVGNLAVPPALIEAMRSSPCVRVELPEVERVRLLMEDYALFIRDTGLFCQRLDFLTELRGKAVIQDWKNRVHAGQLESVVQELLAVHYDPGYATSTQRNFSGYTTAPRVQIADRGDEAMARAARTILYDLPANDRAQPTCQA